MAGPPAWLVGIVAAVAVVAIVGFQFALFASGAGVVMTALAAFWIAAGLAALVEPTRATRNASVVATVIAAIVALYLGVASTRPAPPGTSHGGPNVMPPARSLP